jgi:hypothetical protein
VVKLGNALCGYLLACRGQDEPVTEEGLRREISRQANGFAHNQLVQCATHILSELMPSDAVDKGYSSVYLDPNEHQISSTVNDIRELLLAVGTETFGPSELAGLSQLAEERFRQPIDIGTILWQNVLVGVVDSRGESSYYSLNDSTPTVLPAAPLYVMNPILFDTVPDLRTTLAAPVFP